MHKDTEYSTISAAWDYFGRVPHDQNLLSFRDEFKKLTDADKAEIREGLISLGYNVKPL